MGDSSTDFHYFAFISYKREDEKWAKWLQRKIENYKLPASIAKAHNLPKRLRPVFRDKTDIQPNTLKDEIIERLDSSQYLIVICSPRAVMSNWVGFGIDHFVATGKRDKIIAFIVDGEPYSNDEATECYHPHLRQFFPRSENLYNDKQLLGVNVNEKGKENRFHKRERAVIQVISKMLDVPFDLLWSRAKRKLIKTVLTVTVGVLVVIGCVITGSIQYQRMTAPFDVTIYIAENTPHNPNLPFEKAKVKLYYGNDADSVYITSLSEKVTFRNIPNNYRNNEIRVQFESTGFDKIDTIVIGNQHVTLPVTRNSYWGTYRGIVLDEQMAPVEKAIVTIENHTVLTDKDGVFCVLIPIEEQTQYKKILISKDGFYNWGYEISPSFSGSRKIMLEKTSK